MGKQTVLFVALDHHQSQRLCVLKLVSRISSDLMTYHLKLHGLWPERGKGIEV